MKPNLLFPLALPMPGRSLYPGGCGLSYTQRVFGLLGLGLMLSTAVPGLSQCFTPPPNLGVVGFSPVSVAIGDLNADGRPDLVTANGNGEDNTVSVLLGSEFGGFGAATKFGVGRFAFSVAIGDLNADGRPDLVTANAGDNTVSVLPGNGRGSFGAATNFGVGSRPNSVAIGDLNADGRPDLVTANRISNDVSVLLGNGSGGFGAATNFGVGSRPVSVAIGDLNADGRPDLVTANLLSNTVSVLLGNGRGGFGAATSFGVGSEPASVAIGDLNADGRPDLVTANGNGEDNTVSVLLGNGRGGFGVATNFGVGSSPNSVAIGDLNADGRPDLVTANAGDNTVSVLPGNGSGGFGAATNFGVGRVPASVAIGDLNADGRPDLVTANQISNDVSVLLGNGSGSFTPPPNLGMVGFSPVSVAIGDLNADGRPDLVTANGNGEDNTVSVLLGSEFGGFGAATKFGVGRFAFSVAIGDLNADGRPDLVTANAGDNTVSVLPGNGRGSFGAATNFGVGSRPNSVAIGDLNADGRPDLVTANRISNDVSVLLGNGSGGFGAATNFGVGSRPVSVAIGDLNADGRPDLVTANLLSNTVSVLLGNGRGGFGAATSFGVGSEPASVAIGDLNADGRPDLVTANGNGEDNTVSVLLGNGRGGFGVATNFGVGSSPNSVAIGDLNADGRPDLVTANAGDNTVSVLPGNGSGGFGAATNFGVGRVPASVAIGDLNADGRPDLVTANQISNDVSVLFNCTQSVALVLATSASPNPACAGSTVALSVTASGGTPPYGYTWTAPAGITLSATSTSAVSASVGAGVSGVQTFTLMAAAAGGTPSSTSFVSITVNAAPTNPSLSSGTLTCAQTSLTLTAAATGGTSYTLNGGAGSQTNATGKFVVSRPGNYTAIIGNANGCTAMATSSVVSNTAALTASLTNNGPLSCAVTSVTLTASPSGQTGATLAYRFSAGASQLGSGNQATVSSPGLYSVTVINGGNGCTGVASVSVSQNTTVPVATLSASPSTTLSCAVTSLTLTAGGGTIYAFSGPGVVNQTGNTAIVNASGTYSVTVTNTATGCFSTTSITVTSTTDAPSVSISASATALTCASPTVSLTAVGTGSVRWEDNSTAPVRSVSMAGTYSVTLTAPGGCTATASVSLPGDLAPPINASLSSGTLSCSQTSLTLTASATGGVSYRFSGGTPVGVGQVVVTTTGLYSVTITGANGCTTVAQATVSGSVEEPLAFVQQPASASSVAPGGSVTTTVSVSGSGPLTYQWYKDNLATPVNGQTSATLSLPNVQLADAGSYSVVVTGSCGIGTPTSLTSTAFALQVIPNALVVSLTANPARLLASETTSLSASVSGGTEPYVYRFSGPGVISPTGSTAGVRELPVGVQSFTVVVSDATSPVSLTSSATVSVTVSAANTAPTVANTVSSQTATVGVDYSISLATTFTDQQTPNSLTLSASGLPAGLNLIGTTLSGTPSVSGVSTVTLTATDPGSLSVSTSFVLTVSPAPVVNTAPTVANAVSSQTGTVGQSFVLSLATTFTDQETPNSLTLSASGLPAGLSLVGTTLSGTPSLSGVSTVTLIATDPGSLSASTSFELTVSPAPVVNTAPTVANAISSQTATVGQSYSISLAGTFTDQQTPNSLSLSASGLPAGLSLVGTTLSGTPSVSGVSTVTLTATDPGSLSASTSFVLTVSPASSGTTTAPFAITSVSTISCTPVGDRINFSFTPQYTGTTGQPISFSVVNELSATTAPGPYNLSLYADNPVITLSGVQAGSGAEARFVYNWLAACNNPNPGGNTAPTVANTVSSQTATVGQNFVLNLASTFTDQETPNSLTLSASGLPAGLNLIGTTLSGTPSLSGVSTVTLTATDPGSLSTSTSFVLTVSPASSGTTTAPFAITSVTTLSCAPVGGRIAIRFTPRYAGLTGQPISFSVVNELSATTAPGPYSLSLYADNPSITLSAVQAGGGAEARFVYNWLAACNNLNPGGNTAPTVANTVSSQTATVGQNFVLNLAGTFTDQQTPNSLSLSASGLPAGLNLIGTTLSGTPSVSGVSTVVLIATDPGSLSASTSFVLTVNPASLTTTAPFAITSVTTLSCAPAGGRIAIRFTPQYAGLTGQPISFSVVNELSATTNSGPYSLSLYADNPAITLSAVQAGSGAEARFVYNWLEACNNPSPGGNTAPTLVNAISSQTATVGQNFVLNLASTFTDQETPNSLTLSGSGLPAGLSLVGTTLSGTPSLSGVSTVTLIATDPGSLSASTSFVLTVSPALSVTTTAPFAITSVTTLSCTPVGDRIAIRFTPRYGGLTGQPIAFEVVNELAPTTDGGPYALTLYRDNPVLTLKATQTGSAEVASFRYDWLAACASAGQDNTPPRLNSPVGNQTATVGAGYSLNLSNTFADQETPNSLSLVASGLPAGLSLVGTTLSGTPSVSGVSTVVLTATDPGSLSASTSFMLTVSPASSETTTAPFAITSVTTLSCAVVNGGQRRVSFRPQYAGLSGQPISFSVVNELAPTTDAGPYTLNLYADNPVITLSAQQGSATTTYAYAWLASCLSGSGARWAAPELGPGLQVVVLGNPLTGPEAIIEIRGVEGQPVELQLTDLAGRRLVERSVERAGAVERQRLRVEGQPAGVLLLRVSTPHQTQTVKVLKR